jgi:transcription elongation factor Elf1
MSDNKPDVKPETFTCVKCGKTEWSSKEGDQRPVALCNDCWDDSTQYI